MKIFANKNFWKKIVLILLMLTFFNFIEPIPVNAGIGGDLMEPICALFTGIGDGVVSIIHRLVIGQNTSLVLLDKNEGLLAQILFGVVVGIIVIGAVLLFGPGVLIGAVKAILSATLIVGIPTMLVGGGAIINAVAYTIKDFTNDQIAIPFYSLSPEEIFNNQIPLFNVNFFSEGTTGSEVSNKIKELKRQEVNASQGAKLDLSRFDTLITSYSPTEQKEEAEQGMNINIQRYFSELTIQKLKDSSFYTYEEKDENDGSKLMYYFYNRNESEGIYARGTLLLTFRNLDDTWFSYSLKYCSEDNLIPTVVNTNVEYTTYDFDLRETVAFWYYRLLVFAIIGMMSVLVYIGIRILLSATSASQKAKYKQMLGDWFIGMVLLFSMHYIMTFANLFVDKLTNVVNRVTTKGMHSVVINDVTEKMKREMSEQYNIPDATQEDVGDSPIYSDGNNRWVIETNLMGRLRMELQTKMEENENFVGYTLLFIAMVIYLFMFCKTYLKRVIYMAFLTIIAPLVALTYPIDKVNDGKAQGYNFWFKEYIFNLLIQPLHLLLYTILISSAIQLATEHILYAIAAMGFMTQAEKLMRKMFNFEKASTPGIFGGMAGGALVMSGVRWLMGHGPHSGDKKSGKEGLERDENGKIISSTGANSLKLKKGNMDGSGGSPTPTGGNNTPNNRRRNNPQNTGDGTQTNSPQANPNVRQPNSNSNSDTDVVDGNGAADQTGNQTPQDIDNIDDDDIHFDDDLLASEDNAENKDNEDNQKGFKNMLSQGYQTWYGNTKKRWKRELKNSHPIRSIAELGLGAAGAVSLGIAGLAAGIATGDLDKATQFTAAGLIGGRKLGSNLGKSLGNSAADHLDGVGSQMIRGFKGEEDYQKWKAEKNQKIAKSDENNIIRLQEKLKESRSEAKERAEEAIPFYFDNKITDMGEIVKMEKMVKKYEKDIKEKQITRQKEIKEDKTLSNAEKAKQVEKIKQETKEKMQKLRIDAYYGHHFENQYHISSRPGKEKRDAIREQIMRDYGWGWSQAENAIRLAERYNKVQNNA